MYYQCGSNFIVLFKSHTFLSSFSFWSCSCFSPSSFWRPSILLSASISLPDWFAWLSFVALTSADFFSNSFCIFANSTESLSLSSCRAAIWLFSVSFCAKLANILLPNIHKTRHPTSKNMLFECKMLHFWTQEIYNFVVFNISNLHTGIFNFDKILSRNLS